MQIITPLNDAKIKFRIFSLSHGIKGRTHKDLELLFEPFINAGFVDPRDSLET